MEYRWLERRGDFVYLQCRTKGAKSWRQLAKVPLAEDEHGGRRVVFYDGSEVYLGRPEPARQPPRLRAKPLTWLWPGRLHP